MLNFFFFSKFVECFFFLKSEKNFSRREICLFFCRQRIGNKKKTETVTFWGGKYDRFQLYVNFFQLQDNLNASKSRFILRNDQLVATEKKR